MVPVGVLDNTSALPEAPHNITLDPQGQLYYINLISTDDLHHPVEGLKAPGIVVVVEVAANRVVKRMEVGAFAAGIAPTD